MAIMPGVEWAPLPENETQSRINPTQLIFHTAVDAPGPSNVPAYFARADITAESTFYVRRGGHIVQMMDSEVRADANKGANYRAISVEVEDEGDPEGVPMDAGQMAACKAIAIWCHATHGIPYVQIPSPTAPGIGWHSMFGFRDPLTMLQPITNPWSSAYGKTCPGKTRVKQILALIAELNNEEEPDVTEQEATVFLTILYKTILGREPDFTGLSNWTEAAVKNGWTREDLFWQFLGASAAELGRTQAKANATANRLTQVEDSLEAANARVAALESAKPAASSVDTEVIVDAVVDVLIGRLESA